MLVLRKRLIFWLIRAYIKKWGKIIGFSFLCGLLIFLILLSSSRFLLHLIPLTKNTSIGIVGAYRVDQIPPVLVPQLSHGLTTIQSDGTIQPDIASSWQIKDNGKTYIFFLKHTLYFSDGQNVTTNTISYNFSDVTVEHPSIYTIVYKLHDTYSPFLITVSEPIFKNGFIGIGSYHLENIDQSDNFLKSVSLVSTKNRFDIQNYIFYPTPDSLKIAFALGEVTKAIGLTDTKFKGTDFSTYPHVHVEKAVNYNRLVTLFYNTQDPLLSDKKLRDGLSYAIPDTFETGVRTYLPYPPGTWYFNKEITRKEDFTHAQLLLETSATGKHIPSITIKTLSQFRQTADQIAASWKKIGIQTTIENVDSIPNDFQVYLGDFQVPKDPDQYTLWHSEQGNNITKYKNLRIDKLLEDGRKSIQKEDRIKIYADFQKYLIDDAPASFLYFPYNYIVTRL